MMKKISELSIKHLWPFTLYGLPLTRADRVERGILPDLVLGNCLTNTAFRKAATGPMLCLTCFTISSKTWSSVAFISREKVEAVSTELPWVNHSAPVREDKNISPFFNTQSANGTWPFKGSSLPTTAQSATVPWERTDCNKKSHSFRTSIQEENTWQRIKNP